MRGRKPVPTKLRVLHGNPRKVALPKFEPKPDGDLADAPTWLNEDQRTCWSYAMTNSPPGLLKRIDRGALVAWVVAEDLHRQAAIAQGKVGLLVRIKTRATIGADDPGVPAASPYINIINQQAKIMLKAAGELGFTPVSRPRINASAGPDFRAVAGAIDGGAEGEEMMSLDEYIAAAPKPSVIN
jgi:P27 family predicted phage terminase small subunit